MLRPPLYPSAAWRWSKDAAGEGGDAEVGAVFAGVQHPRDGVRASVPAGCLGDHGYGQVDVAAGIVEAVGALAARLAGSDESAARSWSCHGLRSIGTTHALDACCYLKGRASHIDCDPPHRHNK